jgi:Uma2 family endonuclease
MSAASLMLEIPEIRARISPITVRQYHEFPEKNENGKRTELIRGVVIEKMSKSPLHSSISRRLFGLIQSALPEHFTLLRDDPLTLADSEPEPDLAVVRGDEQDFADRHPSTAALVIEVAVTSAAEDRSLASLYAEAGVEEYWIVLPARRRVEVHRRPEGGAYRDHSIAEGDDTLECTAVPGVRVALGDLFGK